MPIDPYSGRRLRMGEMQEQAVFYSVGEDRKDDKARVEWNYGARKPGDFIVRMEQAFVGK